jgi:hypothetical protein
VRESVNAWAIVSCKEATAGATTHGQEASATNRLGIVINKIMRFLFRRKQFCRSVRAERVPRSS